MRAAPTDSDHSGVRVGIDTGGTFTDIAIALPDGRLRVLKVPSQPDRPDAAVLHGLDAALDAVGVAPSGVGAFLHGTTVATNAFITRTGARVGLVTTLGFRDIINIAYQTRPDLYDPRVTRPAPLAARENIWEIDERVAFDGEVLTPCKPADVAVLSQAIREAQCDVVVVAFLNAYANAANEMNCVQWLRDAGVAQHVHSATEICNEMREYDRTSTAILNAYLVPAISSYVSRVKDGLQRMGVSAPLWIMQSNGGLTDAETASRQSVRTILSGLAGGVIGAAAIAESEQLGQAVSLDVGGTSTDIAFISMGQPAMRASGDLDGYPIRVPSLEVHTIGAGGGSIAWMDAGGSLRVGPQSAGASPGPISYGGGGRQLTVTDAHAALGRLGDSLAAGQITLDVERAQRALVDLGNTLELPWERAAEGIVQIATASMARGIRRVSVERGIDVRQCALIAFGGAGPLHAGELMRALDMTTAIIPAHPGVTAAIGLLDAPVRHDYVETVAQSSARGLTVAMQTTRDALASLRERALADLATRGSGPQAPAIELTVDCRYAGQSYDLTIAWTPDEQELRNNLRAAHQLRYGFSDPEGDVEIVSARVSVIQTGQPTPKAGPPVTGQSGAQPREHRRVFLDGEWRTVAVYSRDALPLGCRIPGPAIVDQLDSTTLVLAGQTLIADEVGCLTIREENAQ